MASFKMRYVAANGFYGLSNECIWICVQEVESGLVEGQIKNFLN